MGLVPALSIPRSCKGPSGTLRLPLRSPGGAITPIGPDLLCQISLRSLVALIQKLHVAYHVGHYAEITEHRLYSDADIRLQTFNSPITTAITPTQGAPN